MDKYIIDTFYKNYIAGHNSFKPTVLYGLSPNTQVIIESFPEYPIIGLLDGFQTEGEIYGKPILDIDMLAGKKCQIIIVARSGTQRIIFQRIKNFCNKNHIPVLNVAGEIFIEDNKLINRNHSYFAVKEEELYKQIDEHDNVSFDVFDTLITRLVHPEDVFFLTALKTGSLNFDFAVERIRAEKHLSGKGVVDIDDIYQEIHRRTQADKQLLEHLKANELQTEEMILKKRDSVVKAFRYALKKGKKVYLISDMYYSKDIIISFLTKSGIYGYLDILVSCDYGTDKANGLYSVYLQKAGVGSCLHIGDSREADGICAKEYGIDSFLIKTPIEMLEISSCQCTVWNIKQELARLEVGIFAANAMNNPFALYGSQGCLMLSSAYQYGYQFLAPLLTEFIFWFITNVEREYLDRVLFISRDGYLMHKMYERIRQFRIKMGDTSIPASIYCLISRNLGIAASLQNDDDIRYAAKLPFNGTGKEMLQRRFFLEEDICQDDNSMYPDIEEYILAHKKAVYTKSNEMRSNYLKYISGFQLDNLSSFGLFDFVSTGTCQMCLEKILNKKLTGLYFYREYENYEPKKNLTIHDFGHDYSSYMEKVKDNYFCLENLLKEPAASVSYIDWEGNVVKNKEYRNAFQLDTIKEVQTGIMDYLEDVLAIRADMLFQGVGMGAKFLAMANDKCVDINIPYIKACNIKDEFTNRMIEVAL